VLRLERGDLFQLSQHLLLVHKGVLQGRQALGERGAEHVDIQFSDLPLCVGLQNGLQTDVIHEEELQDVGMSLAEEREGLDVPAMQEELVLGRSVEAPPSCYTWEGVADTEGRGEEGEVGVGADALSGLRNCLWLCR